MTCAPASRTAAATAGLNVSTEIASLGAARTSSRTTGTTAAASARASTESRLVMLDCAPTSTSRAPSATIASARPTAASVDLGPGSENESGLTFTTPISAGDDSATVTFLARSTLTAISLAP
jgi:hypothetical protein